MDIGSALRVLLRRWLVVLLGVALTAGVGAYLYTNAAPNYQATARMLLLLPPNARGAELDGSPYLYLPNGLNVLAGLVAVAPLSREFQESLVSQGFVSAYTVGVDPTTPAITVSVEGPDPDNVIATRDKLIEAILDELQRVQAEEGTPLRQTAHARIYAAEDTPRQLSGSGLRGLLALAAVGGLITLLAAFGIDRLIQMRRTRRERIREEAEAPGGGDPPPDEPGPPAPDQPEPPAPGTPDGLDQPDPDPAGDDADSTVTAPTPRRGREVRRHARPRKTRRVPDATRRRRARYSAYLPDAVGDSDSP